MSQGEGPARPCVKRLVFLPFPSPSPSAPTVLGSHLLASLLTGLAPALSLPERWLCHSQRGPPHHLAGGAHQPPETVPLLVLNDLFV